MKGQLTLTKDTIEWVITLAVFVGIMLIVLTLWFQFQTIQNEPVEKYTACDLAYMLTMWEEATIHPGIFDKNFLESWNSGDTANSIFENMVDDFFLPDYDYFVKISVGDKKYNMYVPPEAESVFKSCTNSIGIMDILPRFIWLEPLRIVNAGIWMGAVGVTTVNMLREVFSYSKIILDCSVPVYVANGDNVEIGEMVAGLTTNLATHLRDGFYRIGINSEERYFYPLGGYPEGCIANRGSVETEEKIKEELFGNAILDFFWNLISSSFGWAYIKNKIVTCGFDWEWDESTNTITVNPCYGTVLCHNTDCPISTRIPDKIVEKGNLKSKICIPKEAHLRVFNPDDKLKFFLEVENLKPKGKMVDLRLNCEDWCERKEVTGGDICKHGCAYAEAKDYEGCLNYCYSTYGFHIFSRASCVSRCVSGMHYYNLISKLPPDSIDIKYIAVKESVLSGYGGIDNVPIDEYADIDSACEEWTVVGECSTSDSCAGESCVITPEGKAVCGECNELNKYYSCSPGYTELKIPVTKAYFICQGVKNHNWPDKIDTPYFYECLPYIPVKKYLDGDGTKTNIKSVDCSHHPNAVVVWEINASMQCCAKFEEKTEDGETYYSCSVPRPYCLKLKVWSNLNESNIAEIDQNYFIPVIKQRVCRDRYPLNNADEASIVANYPESELEYILLGSEVELKTPKDLSNVGGAQEGAACTTPDDCDSGYCCGDSTSKTCSSTRCEDGDYCENKEECSGGYCCSNICSSAPCPDGSACEISSDCAGGYCCEGICSSVECTSGKDIGESCTDDTECKTNYCCEGVCSSSPCPESPASGVYIENIYYNIIGNSILDPEIEIHMDIVNLDSYEHTIKIEIESPNDLLETSSSYTILPGGTLENIILSSDWDFWSLCSTEGEFYVKIKENSKILYEYGPVDVSEECYYKKDCLDENIVC